MRFEAILEWYSGKARDTIVNFTIPAIVESEALGYWKKGVSRTVHASLNKQNVAAKFSRSLDEQFGEVDQYGTGRKRLGYKHPLYDGASDMLYGSFGRAAKHLTPEAKTKRDAQGDFTFTTKTGPVSANATIERWAQAFAEVAELLALLDSRRPKPVVVMKTLSPTVAKNIGDHIGLDVATIQSPPMHGEWIEFVHKGKKVTVYEIVIDWPAGTQHNQSRFLHSNSNDLCQACGHAIKNPFNWVPILAYGAEPLVGPTGAQGRASTITGPCPTGIQGVTSTVTDSIGPAGLTSVQRWQTVPYSLWVGGDCAEKLFGCEVEGEAIYKR